MKVITVQIIINQLKPPQKIEKTEGFTANDYFKQELQMLREGAERCGSQRWGTAIKTTSRIRLKYSNSECLGIFVID